MYSSYNRCSSTSDGAGLTRSLAWVVGGVDRDPYTRSRCIGQLTIVQFLSYLLRICTPDDGSHEPKHVAPCLLLSK